MRMLAITRLTLLELRHSKLVVLPLTVAVALALIAANIENANAYGTDLLQGTWAGLAVVGALVAILAASSAISSEIERGTMLLLASRPVSRTTILLGKFLAIAIYLTLCALVWAAVLAVGLGSQLDAGAGVAFAGGVLVIAPMLLAAAVALTASAVFPTRGAIGGTLAVWFTASIVGAIPLSSVKPENVARVEWTQNVIGWILPSGRLTDIASAPLASVSMPSASLVALLVIAGWIGAAALLVSLRSSLAR